MKIKTRAENIVGYHEPVLNDWLRREFTEQLWGSPQKWDANANYVTGSCLKEDATNPEPVIIYPYILYTVYCFLSLFETCSVKG